MLGEAQFSRSKPGQVLINIGRGPLIKEPDLIAALQSGALLKGAALDVFCQEPLPQSSPFWDLPNVSTSLAVTTLSPSSVGFAVASQRRHVSAPSSFAACIGLTQCRTTDFRHKSVRLFCDNAYKYLGGDPLTNVIDKRAGY